MNPLDFVERLFSNIGSVFTRIGYLYEKSSDTAKKPWLRRIVVTLVLLVVVVGLVFLGLALIPNARRIRASASAFRRTRIRQEGWP